MRKRKWHRWNSCEVKCGGEGGRWLVWRTQKTRISSVFFNPAFFEKKGEVERPILAAVLLYAPCSRYGYWFYALTAVVGHLRAKSLAALGCAPKCACGRDLRCGTFDRAKVPKARWGVANAPQTPVARSLGAKTCGFLPCRGRQHPSFPRGRRVRVPKL